MLLKKLRLSLISCINFCVSVCRICTFLCEIMRKKNYFQKSSMFFKCRTWSSSDNDQNHHQGWVNVATESVCKAVGWCTSPDGGTPPSPSSSSSSSSPSPLPSPPPSPQSSSPLHESLSSDGQYEASDSPKKSASTFGQSYSPLSRNQVNKKTYTAFGCNSFLSEFVV